MDGPMGEMARKLGMGIVRAKSKKQLAFFKMDGKPRGYAAPLGRIYALSLRISESFR